MTPENRTLAHLASLGYLAGSVERRITRRISRDWLGCIDVLGVHPETGEVVAVQATDATNVAARVKKVAGCEAAMAAMRAAGWRIVVHGWRPDGRLREVDVS